MLVEVFDLTIDGDEIRKDGYAVVAMIEHLEGGNVVNAFGADVKPAWRTVSCNCEHCGTRRNRWLTFIVRHEDGSEKQVGRSCLKDYCGIDPHAIGYLNELEEILISDDIACYDFERRPVQEAYSTVEILALAIRTIKRQGYVKIGDPNSNKNEIATAYAERNRPTEAEMQEARVLAQAIVEINEDDAFDANLHNVQSLIKSEYCKRKHFGYIAYAPVAYEKYIEEMKRRAEREAKTSEERQVSGYVGEIGKRIDIDVSDMKLLTSWETQYGVTFLYKFVDVHGNVLMWFASKPFERVNEDGVYEDVTSVARIKATVKAHTERDGVKQTVITRCKVA